MSKEKQIEEMANDIEVIGCNGRIDFYRTAEILYNAGYRKQSEGIRCKECKHFYQDGNVKVCRHWNCHSTEEDAYCSFAKIKGGAE